MDRPLDTPEIVGRTLAYRHSAWTGLRLTVDGQPVRLRRGAAEIVDAEGTTHRVQVRARPFDPAPTILVGDRTVEASLPLAWYEYAWCALPGALVLVGGAVGGVIGVSAAALNVQQFRSGTGAGRYVRTGAITAAAVLLFLAVATAVSLVAGR